MELHNVKCKRFFNFCVVEQHAHKIEINGAIAIDRHRLYIIKSFGLTLFNPFSLLFFFAASGDSNWKTLFVDGSSVMIIDKNQYQIQIKN